MESVSDLISCTDLYYAATSGQFENLRRKLANGRTVDSMGPAGLTPLQIACTMFNEKCIDILLDHKPSMNIKGLGHSTALYIFVQRFPPNERLLSRFLDEGADPNIPNSEGRTPLHDVIFGSRGVSKTIEKYACLLLQYKADVNSKEEYGNTPLHLAISSNFHGAVTMLLQNEVQINNEILDGQTEFGMPLELHSVFPDVMRLIGEHVITQHFCKKQVKIDQLERVCEIEEMSTFKDRCISELAALKSISVGDSTVTYYDMCFLSPNELARKLHNPFIKESFLKCDRKLFPIFGEHMFQNVQAGLQRVESIDVGEAFLRRLYPGIPQLCLYTIDSFMKNEDLMKLELV